MKYLEIVDDIGGVQHDVGDMGGDSEPAGGKVIDLEAWQRMRELDRLTARFFRDYQQSLRELAARLVGRVHADDIAQDAFMNLAEKFQKHPDPRSLLDSPPDLFKLMKTITARRAYDHLRRRCNHEVARSDLGDRPVGGDPTTGLALDRAYAALPAAQRVAHVLRRYYRCTHTEIAHILQIEESQSTALVSAANQALKQAMRTDP